MADTAPHNLVQMLELLRATGEARDSVSLRTMLEATGRRSFGPLLLLTGIIPLSPLSGVPGLSSVMAACVLLISAQLLLRREHFWLPRWLLHRRISRAQLERLLAFLQPIARVTDRLIHSRLERLTGNGGAYAIALVSTAIAVTMPPLEVVPFANTASGAALTIFGLALVARDGVLVLLGLAVTGCVAVAAVNLAFT